MARSRLYPDMHRCTWILLAALAACGGGDDFTPTLDQPWHPPGPDHQAECTDQCVPVLTSDSHHGDFTIWTNPADDSPRAQWGKCFVQVMACWDPGADLAGCTAAADRCPQPCRDEMVRLGDDEDAFERVFLDDDAPCRQVSS
jgi:hypothetical protein